MIVALSLPRLATLHFALLGVAAVLASGAELFPLRLVYNASASVPLGWYAVEDADTVSIGDTLVVQAPIRFETMLVLRGYLGAGVPLLKQVAARDGMQVCRAGDQVSVDGRTVGTARDADAQGRPLPRWSGCRLLAADEVFLFNAAAPDSFDGRYFGWTKTRDIIGKARPLWTW